MKINWPRLSSPKLYQFYKEWIDWAENDDGVGEGHLQPHYGLCGCLSAAVHIAVRIDDRSDLVKEMKQQFRDANLSSVYPFGEDSYDALVERFALHTCPLRRAWVKQRVTDYEEYHNANKKQ